MSFLDNIVQKNLDLAPADTLVQPRLPGLFELAAPAYEPLVQPVDHSDPAVELKPAQSAGPAPTSPPPQAFVPTPVGESTGPRLEFQPLTHRTPDEPPQAPALFEEPPAPARIRPAQPAAFPAPATSPQSTDRVGRVTPVALPHSTDRGVKPKGEAEVSTKIEEPTLPALPTSLTPTRYKPSPVASIYVKSAPQPASKPVESQPEPRRWRKAPKRVLPGPAPSRPPFSRDLPKTEHLPVDQAASEPAIVEIQHSFIEVVPDPRPASPPKHRQPGEVRLTPMVRSNLLEQVPGRPAEPPPAPIINVRIGRIEVKATSRPEQKSKKSKQAPLPVMSLDDYLEHRSRGGGR